MAPLPNSCIVAVGVDGAVGAALVAQQERLGAAVQLVSEGELRAALTTLAACLDALVIGASVAEPVAMAQRAYGSAPQTPVLITCATERRSAIEGAIRFAPFLSHVGCIANGDTAAVMAAVEQSVSGSRRRKSLRRGVAALNARIAADRPQMPAVADLLTRLLDSAPIGIVLMDAQGRVRSWNPRAGVILGGTERQALGEPLDQFFNDAAIAAVAALKADATAQKKPLAAVIQRNHVLIGDLAVESAQRTAADQRSQHVEVTVAPLSDRIGEGHIVILQDATSRVEATAALQRAIRARDEFLSIASHELNTPLTPMKLHLTRLRTELAPEQSGPPAAGMIERRLTAIDKQVARLERLVREMLNVSRITTSGLRVEKTEVDLGRAVADIAETFSLDDTSGGQLHLALDEGVLGQWDVRALELIVSNLISNGLKYGVGKPVHVSVRKEGAHAKLTVSDEGIGIAEQDHERIFSLFERAVSTDNFGGFGVGLFIVKSAVEALGGELAVESTLGQGSTFKVRLPLG